VDSAATLADIDFVLKGRNEVSAFCDTCGVFFDDFFFKPSHQLKDTKKGSGKSHVKLIKVSLNYSIRLLLARFYLVAPRLPTL
jgi:hypothetical protein